MMKRAISCAALVLLTGCTKYVIRERETYEAEVRFIERLSSETSTTLKDIVGKFCVCTDGQWSNRVCADAEVKQALFEQRLPYHTGMMLYLAGIEKREPADPSDDLVLQCGGDE